MSNESQFATGNSELCCYPRYQWQIISALVKLKIIQANYYICMAKLQLVNDAATCLPEGRLFMIRGNNFGIAANSVNLCVVSNPDRLYNLYQLLFRLHQINYITKTIDR